MRSSGKTCAKIFTNYLTPMSIRRKNKHLRNHKKVFLHILNFLKIRTKEILSCSTFCRMLKEFESIKIEKNFKKVQKII